MGKAANQGPVVAVDAMGGDKGPGVVVDGVLEALREYPNRILLAGDETVLTEALAARGALNHPDITLLPAPDVITMEDSPVEAVREKRRSSLVMAARAVRDGRAAALLSPANTGAVLAAGTLIVGRIKGVERPGIAALIPHKKNGFTVLIDVGANAESRATHLLHFAIMGMAYGRAIIGIESPRVGLLSIGTERTKGNELTKEALPLFERFFDGNAAFGATFLGNVEGKDITNGNADIVVCDGFVGNVLLKFGESLAFTFMDLLKGHLTENPLRSAAALMLRSAFRDFKKRIDYTEYGGAPLLGVKHPCIICHGSSNAKAIKNAIRVAGEEIAQDVCGRTAAMIAAIVEGDGRKIS